MSNPKPLSPQEVNNQAKGNFSWLTQMMPSMSFNEANNNLLEFKKGDLSGAKSIINDMVASVPPNPMSAWFNSLFGGGEQAPQVAQQVFAPEPVAPQPQPPQPQLSPYEQQLQYLMNERGMTRAEAIRNQQNALDLGTDYNNDGAVTGDEWKKYGQTAQGAQYRAKHEPNWQGGPRVQPNINNLDPRTRAALLNFQKYAGGNGGQ